MQRKTGPMRRVKGYSANLERCECRRKCGAVEESWEAKIQLKGDAVEELVEELEIEVSSEKIVRCWLQLNHIFAE